MCFFLLNWYLFVSLPCWGSVLSQGNLTTVEAVDLTSGLKDCSEVQILWQVNLFMHKYCKCVINACLQLCLSTI